jgi:aminopeptidase N
MSNLLPGKLRAVALAFLALPLACLLASCQPDEAPPPLPEPAAAGVARPAIDSLDLATAQARKARIGDIDYDLTISLDPDQFSGSVTIRFELASADDGSDLTLDFSGGQVLASTLNGDAAELPYNGFFITLPGASLLPGRNELSIRFKQEYSENGTGLHRFTDPEDGRVYLYTYLWPYYANRVFPAFDQPNLKARFSLQVDAPEGWVVVSTASGTPGPASENGMTRWQFETTPKIASYAFSLHAGPYTVWEADADGIPLRLMARQSLTEFVAVDEWFEVTRKGLQYYGEYYDIPYPFGKYDQVLVPDFAIGAMENIAAVTFNELIYVQRQPSSRNEREHRAGTILHEMAHMWFGDLVTHHWWNGMWLNESFATQMAAMAELKTTEFDDVWHGFFTDAKQRAYHEDSRVTTHPIEMPVNSTIDFFLVFDDITYQKGASVLKQLAHYVGEENYRQGVSAYLKANAYGNTELDDFVAFQSRASGKDIEAWADEWLYQAGFNTLEAQADCENGQLGALTILQSAPPEHPTLRHHQVEVALYAAAPDGSLLEPTVLPVSIAAAETVVAVPPGLACPVLMNPNHNDWTLAQVRLDAHSLETLQSRLQEVPEPLARSMFLAALHNRVMSGAAPLATYLDLAAQLVGTEPVIRIQQQLSASVIETVNFMLRLRPETDAALASRLPMLEAAYLQQASGAGSSDLKRNGLNTFLAIAGSESGLATLQELLDGSRQVPGIDITADLRWQILFRLAAQEQFNAEALLAAESVADHSDYGQKQLLMAQAARPDAGNKSQWLAELQSPESLTGMSRQRAVLAGMFPANQSELQKQLLDQILPSLPALSHKVDPYFMTSYVESLLKPMCSEESVAKMGQALETMAGQLDSTALRFLREAHQADEECLALRSLQ